jgi:hypothetical protein
VPFARPFRYYDSRTGDGPIVAGRSRGLRLAGWPDADPMMARPADGAMSAVFNLTVTNTTEGGYVTAYPGEASGAPPLASTVNFGAGHTAATLSATRYGDDGQVSFYNPAGATDVIVDVSGFFTSSSF